MIPDVRRRISAQKRVRRLRVCAKTSPGLKAYFKQNHPHPDPLLSGMCLARSAAVLGSSNVSTPTILARAQSFCARGRAHSAKHISRPTGEGTVRSVSRSFYSGWKHRPTEDDSPSPIRWERAGVRVSVPQNPKLFLHESLPRGQRFRNQGFKSDLTSGATV